MSAARYKGYISDYTPTSPLKVIVDSVDTREDLTRIYAHLHGMPHTSNRIDSVTLVTGSAKYVATDIDGVDFNRYFQWEDMPDIDIELDFPAITNFPDSFVVKITTPRGESIINVDKQK